MFNVFNEDGLHIGEVKVDINPITAQRTGTLETYLLQAEEYLESIRQEREQELTQQIQTQGEMEKEEVEVTLMVSECGEFHNLGEFYENIPTVEEAIAEQLIHQLEILDIRCKHIHALTGMLPDKALSLIEKALPVI